MCDFVDSVPTVRRKQHCIVAGRQVTALFSVRRSIGNMNIPLVVLTNSTLLPALKLPRTALDWWNFISYLQFKLWLLCVLA